MSLPSDEPMSDVLAALKSIKCEIEKKSNPGFTAIDLKPPIYPSPEIINHQNKTDLNLLIFFFRLGNALAKRGVPPFTE